MSFCTLSVSTMQRLWSSTFLPSCSPAMAAATTAIRVCLFTPGMDWKEPDNVQVTTPAMRRMLLQALLQEESYRPLFDYPVFTDALEKLKASV